MSPYNKTDCKSDFIVLLKIKERAEDRINNILVDKMKQMFLCVLLGRKNQFTQDSPLGILEHTGLPSITPRFSSDVISSSKPFPTSRTTQIYIRCIHYVPVFQNCLLTPSAQASSHHTAILFTYYSHSLHCELLRAVFAHVFGFRACSIVSSTGEVPRKCL